MHYQRGYDNASIMTSPRDWVVTYAGIRPRELRSYSLSHVMVVLLTVLAACIDVSLPSFLKLQLPNTIKCLAFTTNLVLFDQIKSWFYCLPTMTYTTRTDAVIGSS